MTTPRCPLWMTLLIIICSLPVFALPALLAAPGADNPDIKPFLWLYPIYVVVTAVCARMCYPSRKALTWILLALMLLTHAAMWLLVNP